MKLLRNGYRKWGMAILIVCAVLGFAATIIFGIYLLNKQREQNTQLFAQERRARMAAEERRRHVDTQIRLNAYVLCRSGGRTPKECRRISQGTILPPNLTLEDIEAHFAKIAEIQVQRIFVKGEPGLTGATGPRGAPGLRGGRGATGKRGASGQRGPQGQRGANGSNGSNGARGPVGPPGPTGPMGPAGSCPAGSAWKLVSIPSVGQVYVCKVG